MCWSLGGAGLANNTHHKNAYREHTDKKCMPSESVNKSYVFCLLSDSKGETLSRTRSHRPKSEGQQQSPTTTRHKPKDKNREIQSRERQARKRQPDTQEPCPRSPHEGTGENIPPSRNPSPAGRWSVSERNRAQGSGTKTQRQKQKDLSAQAGPSGTTLAQDSQKQDGSRANRPNR